MIFRIMTDLSNGVEKKKIKLSDKTNFSHLNVACHAKMRPFYEILRKTEEKKVLLFFAFSHVLTSILTSENG